MEREQIIKELGKYFNVKELVCDHTYAKHGEASWQFLDTMYLWCLLILRCDILKAPMTCNYKGYMQRGLRCNMCEIVKGKTKNYLSAHVLGKAGDFTVSGMTAEQARKKIAQNAHLLPCNVRVEDKVTWLHFDTINQYGINSKVYFFKV